MNGLNRTDDRSLLLAAITGDHDLFKLTCLFIEHNIQQFRSVHIHLFLLETDVVELKDGFVACRNINVEHTVDIGEGMYISSYQGNRDTYQRLLFTVGHHTRYLRGFRILLYCGGSLGQ